MEGHALDHRSDIYSLGIMLFQMLTGKMPINADTRTFGGWYHAHREKSPRSIGAASPGIKVPKLLESLIMSCLEKDPDNRPQNVTDVITELDPLWERYRRNEGIGGRIKGLLNNISVQSPTSQATQAQTQADSSHPATPNGVNLAPNFPEKQSSPDKFCRLHSWPSNMPTAEIVFPRVLQTSRRALATLWVMLPQAAIDALERCLPYNQYLFTPSPYPILLWLTVLHSSDNKPKWLPCYLDLKQASGRQMLELLKESREYRILFFAMENTTTMCPSAYSKYFGAITSPVWADVTIQHESFW